MLRFLWKSMRHSFRLHLLVPLALFVAWELTITAVVAPEGITPRWVMHEFLPRLAGVYVTFIVIVGFVLSEEGAARTTNIGALEGALSGAKEYFAISPTSTREWFEPAPQVYLARLVAAKFNNAQFTHRRVLLFFSKGSFRDVKATYLDGYHAQCLVDWHMYFKIPVRFIRPQEILEVLNALTPDQQRLVGYRKWPPTHFWLWRLKRKGTLAFALVTAQSGAKGVVRFHKSPHELEVTYHTDLQTVGVYSRLAELIGEKAKQDGNDLVHYVLGVPGPPL